MILSVQQIKFEMLGYIKEFDARFDAWYVGIASDPKRKMQADHGVDLEADIWLYKQAASFLACKTIQRYFVEKLRTKGGLLDSGQKDMDCIYLYRISDRTSP